MENLSGKTVKGYELLERIGSGGFGAVYRAYQTTVGREVAVKIILPGFANNPEFIRRFEAEAQIIARLEHPYIVPLHDYWREPDGAYLVMRYFRGGSLRDALQNDSFALEATALLLDQITAALSVAHRNNVIHRDLKPANILLDEDGNAYLADFGIAKDIGSIQKSLTKPDAIIGSLDYISPEQARSEPVTPRTDIYSLGVVIYEMLVGQHPFHDVSSVERLYKHLNDPLPDITHFAPELGNAINTLIQKATAKNPMKRYADALDLATAFREGAALSPLTGDSMIEILTLREQEVLQCIVEGLSNKEIAQKLFITVATVKWHVKQIYRKLGVRSRVQATIRARELNLLVFGETTVIDSPRVADSMTMKPLLPEPKNPYKGLRAFQPADHDDFFGREALIDDLVSQLAENGAMSRFLAIVGPSGSGKSSLVKAGLIPALWRGDLSGSERWFIVDMLPGTHPLDTLEVALMKVAADQAGNLREQLQRDERGLLRVADLILPDDSSDLVLIIDQFEEVFTLVDDEAVREHFLAMLTTAVIAPRSRVRIVVTLRADFYDRPLRYPGFGELVRDQMQTIMPLSAEELERAIVRPAKQVGVKFEEGLVPAIIEEIHYQPGGLPLLQYALTELFEQRDNHTLTHAAYQTIGGMVGALAGRADEIFDGLDKAGQETTRQMFLRLVTLGEGVEDTRRRVKRSELLAVTEDFDLMDEIIDTYAGYRLLALDNDPETRSPTVEVGHEAILREWERLRSWLNEYRDEIRLQRQLSHATEEWIEAGQDTSYLVRGTRLEQLESWVAETELALTGKERQFLEASIAEQEQQNMLEDTRKRRFRLGVSVAFAIVTILGVLSFLLYRQSESNLGLAQRRADEAASIALAIRAQQVFDNGDSLLALSLAQIANRIPDPPLDVQRTLNNLSYYPGIRRIVDQRHTDAVRSVAFSPDGRMALSGSCAEGGTNCVRGELFLWDVATGQQLHNMEGHTAGVNDAIFNPDPNVRTAVSASDDQTLILWDVDQTSSTFGQQLHTFAGHTGEVNSVAFSHNGKTALSASNDQTLILWDVDQTSSTFGQQLHTFTGHTAGWQSVAFSPDGRIAISASTHSDGTLWDVDMSSPTFGEQLQSLAGHSGVVNNVVFSPDGKTVLSAATDSTLILWDIDATSPTFGEQLRIFVGYSHQPVNDVAFSPDGRTAVSVSDDSLIVWDVDPTSPTVNQKLQTLTGHTGFLRNVAFSPDGRTVLTGSICGSDRSCGELILWDVAPGAQLQTFIGHTSPVYNVAFSHDGRTALSASFDDTLILWDVDTASPDFGKQILTLEGHTDRVYGVDFSADGRIALSGSFDNTLILWNVDTSSPDFGEQIHTLEGHTDQVYDVVFNPDDRTALSASEDGTLILWDVDEASATFGQPLRNLEGHTWAVNSAAFSPDGRTALSASKDSTLILWDVDQTSPTFGQQRHTLEGHSSWVWDVAFSPDGQTALSVSEDGTLILWDVDEASATFGQQIRTFVDNVSRMSSVDFSADGRTALASSCGDLDSHYYYYCDVGTITLWDIETGEQLSTFTGHAGAVFNVAFSPNGQTALSASADHTARLWRIDSPDELGNWVAENRYTRELTCQERYDYNVEPYCNDDDEYLVHATPPTSDSVTTTPADDQAQVVAPLPDTYDSVPGLEGVARQDVVRFAIDGQPGTIADYDSFNPFVGYNLRDVGYHQSVAEPLFILNYETGEIQPWLAESMVANETLDTWTLNLRHGAYWSDGEPFNADDVIFTMEMLLDPNNIDLDYAEWLQELVDSVEAIDEYTVVFNLTQPNPRFQSDFFSVRIWGSLNIMPEHVWADKDPFTFNNFDLEQGWPLGTGPYKLVSASETEFVYARDDNWWGVATGVFAQPEPPYLMWVVTGDYQDQLNTVINHELDSILSLPWGAFEEFIAQNSNLIAWNDGKPWTWVDPCPRRLVVNHTVVPWDNPAMRRMLNFATDRAEIVEVAYQGTTLPARSMFAEYGSMSPFIAPMEAAGLTLSPTANLDAATNILSEQGYFRNADGYWEKDGQILSLIIQSPDNFSEFERIMDDLVQQYQRFGIDAITSNLSVSDWSDNELFGNFEATIDWDACGSINEPWASMYRYHADWVQPVGEFAPNNYARWSGEANDHFSAIVDQIGTLQLGDPAIADLVVEAMGIWYDEMPDVPLTQARKLSPFDTTYWIGWPTAENNYIHPPTWWQSTHQILQHLERAE
ncbi:ABC transporter substrate-binding protein [Chloroflexota bacterium]